MVFYCRVGFEGWILVLIASVPGLCILLTVTYFWGALYSDLRCTR